jgi:hypothetical protein
MKIPIIFLFICLTAFSCLARDLSQPPLRIEGGKIADSSQARKIAMEAYMEKMDYKLSATAGARDIDIRILGDDIQNFGKKGDRIWEARITDLEELKALLWIHPVTEKIYFVYAPARAMNLPESFLTLEQMKLAREQAQHLELSGTAISNCVLKVEGFMKRTKIVQTNAAIAAKLSIAKDKMRVLRKPRDAQVDTGKGPQTLDEAAEYLRRHVSMAYPPSACIEQDGVFYFSGGTSTEAVEDFSSGFAIKKGEADILTWDKTEKGKEER